LSKQIEPFNSALAQSQSATNQPLLGSEATAVSQASAKKSGLSLQLHKEDWFHGPISRK